MDVKLTPTAQTVSAPLKKKIARWLRLLPLTIVAVSILFFFRVHNVFHSHWRVMPEHAMAGGGGDKKQKEKPLDAEIKKKVFGNQEKTVIKSPIGFDSAQVDILQSLAKRRQKLDGYKDMLDKRETTVLIAEKKVSEKLVELNKLREALDKKLGLLDEKEAKKMDGLSKMYQSMKPQDAANIFNKVDMEILLAVLGKMSPIKSSAILAKMDTEKAREITAAIAEGTVKSPQTKEMKEKIKS